MFEPNRDLRLIARGKARAGRIFFSRAVTAQLHLRLLCITMHTRTMMRCNRAGGRKCTGWQADKQTERNTDRQADGRSGRHRNANDMTDDVWPRCWHRWQHWNAHVGGSVAVRERRMGGKIQFNIHNVVCNWKLTVTAPSKTPEDFSCSVPKKSAGEFQSTLFLRSVFFYA